MKRLLKKYVKIAMRQKVFNEWMAQVKLCRNFFRDYCLYRRYSTVFSLDSLEKKEAKIIIDYHAIEKGLLHDPLRSRFAEARILRLSALLEDPTIVIAVREHSQIRVAYQVMCQYYELHERLEVEIEDFYPKRSYVRYRDILGNLYDPVFQSAIECTKDEFYAHISQPFDQFAHSRKSIRDFTGEKVPAECLEKAIQLALTSPSVCNRQASKVYVIDDPQKIQQCLDIQGGFRGFSEYVSQLLILTNDRRYYYTIGERNQFYIDGGIFLMNLLYALHFYQIANCPANWGKDILAESRLNSVIHLHEAEKIICMIPIGIAKKSFKITLSERKKLNEVFYSLS